MISITERIERDGITADVKFGTHAAPVEFPAGSNSWDVTLHFQGRTLEVPFHTGPAITEEPTSAVVLDCLVSDASGILEADDILEWASNYGYSLEDYAERTRSRRIYAACVKQTEELRTFLAEEFDAYLYETESL